MPIPESQLNTWANVGATTSSSRAYASIKNALFAQGSPLLARQPEVFLQGSYANDTNIYGDSDIDVVVLYSDSYHYDLHGLTPQEQERHHQYFQPATYTWAHLNAEVLAALRSYYGHNAVTPGKKAIKVDTGQGRMTADVIPGLQFRYYTAYNSPQDLRAHWGMQFFDSSGNAVVNYPKQHIHNGQAKNALQRANGEYKPTVRIFKNLRNHLVRSGLLADGIAPSYFIEGALSNVPDHFFGGPLVTRVFSILGHLTATPMDQLQCQNGLIPLIGGDSTQWRADRYVEFLSAALSAFS
jgi:Nucleotidyltransferase domain